VEYRKVVLKEKLRGV
jgi:hypothetical protein